VRFLVDAQLPPALALWLREAEDSQIWHYALEHQTILITKDEDFIERARQSNSAPVLVWLRIGNVSNRALRQWLLPQLPQILTWIEQGVRVLEIR
jgi:predicted nuclease of predicted toxin-antitoxin system